uniref:hypothetical protein n=1 Tax=Elmerina hispida TaxID=1245649 RepID=UPI0030020851|nr:hypothetical protein [Elmerina hispida]
MLTEAAKPAIENFLETRGLTLSTEKTKLISIRAGEKVKFLGYNFQYIQGFKPKYKLFHDRIGKEGIACYPQKEKLDAISLKLRKIIDANYNKTAYELIRKLNPIIRG